jgi:hypothetical protein
MAIRIRVNTMLYIRIPKAKKSREAKLMDASHPLDEFTIGHSASQKYGALRNDVTDGIRRTRLVAM